MKTDHSKMKLGKSAPIHDPRTLLLANYIKAGLPPAPVQYTYAADIAANSWGMMENDKIGDCTCAAAGHLIMKWTDDNGKIVIPSDKSVVAAYSAITGYNPATRTNDNGAVVLEYLLR